MSKFYKDFKLTESQLNKAKLWFVAQELVKELEYNELLNYALNNDNKKLFIDHVDPRGFTITNVHDEDISDIEGCIQLGYSEATGTITIYTLNLENEELKALCVEEIKKSASKLFNNIKFKGECCLC